jgi:hypothetical protein
MTTSCMTTSFLGCARATPWAHPMYGRYQLASYTMVVVQIVIQAAGAALGLPRIEAWLGWLLIGGWCALHAVIAIVGPSSVMPSWDQISQMGWVSDEVQHPPVAARQAWRAAQKWRQVALGGPVVPARADVLQQRSAPMACRSLGRKAVPSSTTSCDACVGVGL